MRNKIFTTAFMTTIVFSLLFSPTAFIGYKVDKNTRQILGDNTDYDHPEKIYSLYHNVDTDVIPVDLFGDWVIPEGPVLIDADLADLWKGQGDYYGNEMKESWIVRESFYDVEEGSAIPNFRDRQNWHNKYNNWIMPVPDESGRFWNENSNSWEKADTWSGFTTDDSRIVSTTPMRGIIPFWENTHAFNTYVLNETDNGSKESDNLHYEVSYASYINDYVSSSETKYPTIYKYLEDPSLLYDIFITNDDSVDWILPDDYQLVNSDDLTNAFVGFDGTWEVVNFLEYMFDFIIWNWNTNELPYKTDLSYYDQLKDLNAGDIRVMVLGDYENTDYSRVSLYGDGVIYDDGMGYPIDGVTMDEYNTIGVWVSNEGSDGIYTSADVIEYYQTMGLVFGYTDRSDMYYSPSYKWSQEKQWNSAYTDEDNYFEMYDPFEQQMNVNITPTSISFDGLDIRYNEQLELIESDEDVEKLYIESSVSEFTTPFEEWLINSETGINKYFVDFYSDCHVNDYYNNYSGDGTAFLGRNRFQSGIYPVEDLRLNDLIITYTDQDGNVVDGDTLLGDIRTLNISIEFNTESDNAKLFDATAATPVSMSFNTSDLESRIPPVTPDEGGTHLILIIVIALLVLSVVGAIFVVMTKKNKKESK